MDDMDDMDGERQERCLQRLAGIRRDIDTARDSVSGAVDEALRAGVPVTQIAQALGRSRQSLYVAGLVPAREPARDK